MSKKFEFREFTGMEYVMLSPSASKAVILGVGRPFLNGEPACSYNTYMHTPGRLNTRLLYYQVIIISYNYIREEIFFITK